HESGFSVVDVGDDGEVADLEGHTGAVAGNRAGAGYGRFFSDWQGGRPRRDEAFSPYPPGFRKASGVEAEEPARSRSPERVVFTVVCRCAQQAVNKAAKFGARPSRTRSGTSPGGVPWLSLNVSREGRLAR